MSSHSLVVASTSRLARSSSAPAADLPEGAASGEGAMRPLTLTLVYLVKFSMLCELINASTENAHVSTPPSSTRSTSVTEQPNPSTHRPGRVSTAGAPAARAAVAAAPASKGGRAAAPLAIFLMSDRRVDPGGAARAAVSLRNPRVALSTVSRGTGSCAAAGAAATRVLLLGCWRLAGEVELS